MGKKNKKKKKEKIYKTKEQRIEEVNKIKNKIESFGLSEEHKGIPELYKVLDDFEKDGYSNSGKIKLPGLKRVVYFILTVNQKIESTVSLKYNPDV